MIKQLYTYTVTSRPESLGSGWKLSVFEDGQEISGGIFPAGDDGYCEAIDQAQWMIEGMVPSA